MSHTRADASRVSTRSLRTAIFREATAIVRADISRSLTVQEVAQRVATSPRQLRRAFSEIGGTGFRAYLLSERMARAAELLTSTDVPVRDVGRRVGYRQASQFTKAFKRTYAETPSAFRARRRGS